MRGRWPRIEGVECCLDSSPLGVLAGFWLDGLPIPDHFLFQQLLEGVDVPPEDPGQQLRIEGQTVEIQRFTELLYFWW